MSSYSNDISKSKDLNWSLREKQRPISHMGNEKHQFDHQKVSNDSQIND